jgi:ABC-type multidrug transport system fused ATPase/permease subunit
MVSWVKAGTLVVGVLAGLRLLSGREKRSAVLLTVATVAASAIEIVVIAAILPFINVVIQPGAVRTNVMLRRLYEVSGARNEPEFVYLMGGAVLVGVLASAVAGWVLLLAQNRFAAGCQVRLGTEMLERCLRAPYPWFLARNSTMLSRLVYDDVVFWSRAFVHRLTLMAKDTLIVVMAVGLVLTLSPRTGIAVVAAVAVLGYVSVVVTRPLLTRLASAKREALGATLLTAQQALAGIKDVKLSSRESYFVGLFHRAYLTMAESHAGLNVWQETPSMVMRVLAQATLVVLAVVFWRMGLDGGQLATQLTLLLVVATKVVPAVSALSSAVGSLVNALPHIDAIRDGLASIDAETTRVERGTVGAPVETWQSIRFDAVGYGYPGAAEPALRDLHLELRRPGAYGIVGRSAAGKSTLVDLVIRLLEPTEGRVWLDARPMDGVARKDWQRRIGYVPQAPFMADDTLRANVAFGVPRASVDDAWVIECLRMANLGDLIQDLEQGLDTRIGERGSRLSGGQRQRVAIARALFNRPEILVLDEATSALDTVSEAEVQAALKNLRDHVMVVTIAHRVSTVAPCDEIFVLDQGRLVGRGSYAELLSQHDLFRKIADATA